MFTELVPKSDSAVAGAVKPRLLLFGAGGHAKVVADAALASGEWAGLIASDRKPERCSIELLHDVAMYFLPELAGRYDKVHVSIGDNASREAEAAELGTEHLATVMHPRATVSPHAHVAAGCFIAAQAVVAPGAQLGHGVIINHSAVVDHDVQVGAFSHVAPGAVLGGAVRIGTRVLVGAGAVVLPGVAVCDDAVIGAGAVVCVSVLDAGTWAGVPARKML